jgi:hypothetical protein
MRGNGLHCERVSIQFIVMTSLRNILGAVFVLNSEQLPHATSKDFSKGNQEGYD